MNRCHDPEGFEPPPRREEELAAREEELKDLLAHGSRNFRMYRRNARLYSAVLTLGFTFALYGLWHQGQQIQKERERSIRTGCVEQNARHDHTIRTLDTRIAVIRGTASPKRVARLEESRKFTVAIIDALAPKRDCEALVRRSVSS